MKIPKGKLVFIIGKVGSGKSSVLYSLAGEMKQTNLNSADRPSISPPNCSMFRQGSVAILTDKSWLMPKSIKENICVGKPFEEDRLRHCIKISQFDHDLALMSDDIETVIGENGVSLSGGQRTRLSLARCLYQQ